MFTSKRVLVAALSALLLGACAAPMTSSVAPTRGPNLGRVATAQEIAAADISIPPDGTGLPAGSGTAQQGAAVYAGKCIACHGEKGVGKPADALVGGIGSLASKTPQRTVGSYWPYATTLFDYVRRAMPIQSPKSLTNDEAYAVTAYLLNINGVVAGDAVMNAQSLPQVKMTNRDGFVDYSRK